MGEDAFDEIIKEMEEKLKAVARETAKEVQSLIEAEYVSTILEFYNDYQPRSYHRTEYTFYGSNKYDGPARHARNTVPAYKDGFIGGISVSADYIPENPYRADTEWVFNRTFEKGIHGYTRNEMLKRFHKLVSKNKKQRTYQKFTFTYQEEKQTVLKPSPEKRLEKKVRKLATNKTIDNIVDKKIEDIFFAK